MPLGRFLWARPPLLANSALARLADTSRSAWGGTQSSKLSSLLLSPLPLEWGMSVSESTRSSSWGEGAAGGCFTDEVCSLGKGTIAEETGTLAPRAANSPSKWITWKKNKWITWWKKKKNEPPGEKKWITWWKNKNKWITWWNNKNKWTTWWKNKNKWTTWWKTNEPPGEKKGITWWKTKNVPPGEKKKQMNHLVKKKMNHLVKKTKKNESPGEKTKKMNHLVKKLKQMNHLVKKMNHLVKKNESPGEKKQMNHLVKKNEPPGEKKWITWWKKK